MGTDDNKSYEIETAFKVYKCCKMLQELLWQFYHEEFDVEFGKENREMEARNDLF